jgi:hypothetical protein
MTDTGDLDGERIALDLMLRGFMVSRMLRLVAELAVADHVAADAPAPIEAVAAACGADAQRLRRVLQAVAAFGVFRVTPDGRVAHTARSRLLRSDTPNSLGHAARFWTGRGSWRAWEEFDAAMTGGVPHDAAWGMGRFAYLREHQDEARLFDAMMAHFPDNRHAALAAGYDFSAARLICDVGGGNGAALRHILARFPEARGLLLDLPDVIAAIPEAQRMEGRIATVPGSFLDQVPAGADHYVIVRVLHDWGDEDCLRILRNCRAAMAPGTRLLIVEQVLPEDPASGHPTAYLADVHMMAMFGAARERTAREFEALLAATGFALRRLLPTASPVSIVEAEATGP